MNIETFIFFEIMAKKSSAFCELLNTLGQAVWSGTGIENQDFSSLRKGIYLLNVKADKASQSIKLIKQ